MSVLRPIATRSQWKEGETKAFVLYPGVSGIAIKKGDHIFAYKNSCTHMGGLVELKGEEFCCRQHHATFDLQTGQATGGQAPSGSFLTKVETVLKDDGIVYALVDLPVDPFA